MKESLSQDIQSNIIEMCTLRHKLHKVTFNVSKNIYENNVYELVNLCNNIKVPGVKEINIEEEAIELLDLFDLKDYDSFCEKKEKMNLHIENYLKEIDFVYGTKYCPSGALRNSNYTSSLNHYIEVKKGMVFWVDRAANGLFSNDGDKTKRIPALIISPDDWNYSHDNFTVVSIARKDEYIKDCEYNIDISLNDIDHIVRCFNPFTIRRMHIGGYVTKLDEATMSKVSNCISKFTNANAVFNNDEIELSSTIERIMREKHELIKRETIKSTCKESMKIIIKQLNSLYPENDNKEQYIKTKKIENISVNNCQQSSYNKWDKDTAKQFLKDYNESKNKKELVKKYNFKNISSVYTRAGRCKEILGIK